MAPKPPKPSITADAARLSAQDSVQRAETRANRAAIQALQEKRQARLQELDAAVGDELKSSESALETKRQPLPIRLPSNPRDRNPPSTFIFGPSEISSPDPLFAPPESDDDRFWREFLYVFELQVPQSVMGSQSSSVLMFPLILSPEALFTSEPYTVQTTPGGDGGLYVEENGVLGRSIRIVGTTGFTKKPLHPLDNGVAAHEGITGTGVSRGRAKYSVAALSGQRHFQFLQDRVFRTYSELKRNPVYAPDTRLVFHNIKDEESWYVAPIRFDMRRAVNRRFLYQYDIQLLAYRPYTQGQPSTTGLEAREVAGTAAKQIKAAAKNLDVQTFNIQTLEDFRAALAVVRENAINAIDRGLSFVRDAEAAVTSFSETVRSTVTTALSIANKALNYAEGLTRFITTPLRALADVARGLTSVIQRVLSLPAQVQAEVTAAFRNLKDSVIKLMTVKSKFAPPPSSKAAVLERLRARQTAVSSARLETADRTQTRNIRGLSQGTGPQRGDLDASAHDPVPAVIEYRSVKEHQVTSADTIESIAQRLVGTASAARDIILANNLLPPYISRTPLPGTVQPGDTLLVPSKEPDRGDLPEVRGIYPAVPEVPFRERRLGRDLLLSPVDGTRDQFDLVLDASTVDIKTVAGVDNLKQALRTRLSTERGTLVMAPNLGYRRVVGSGVTVADREVAKIQIKDAVASDPRVASVLRIDLNPNVSFDTLDADLTVRLVDIDGAVDAQVRVPA